MHLTGNFGRAGVFFAAIAISLAAPAAEPIRTMPRAEECIDVARLNSVSEAERAVLRIEWRAGLARAEESRLLNEMYERIERLQRTTNEIRVLMNAIPTVSEKSAALNSPSGLGPSAVIPPLTGAPKSASPSPANAASSASAESKRTEPPSPAPSTLPATQNATAPSQPSVVPNVAKPKAPLQVVEPAQQSSFTFRVPSLLELSGVGLVAVAFVVLWWLRRRETPNRVTQSGESIGPRPEMPLPPALPNPEISRHQITVAPAVASKTAAEPAKTDNAAIPPPASPAESADDHAKTVIFTLPDKALDGALPTFEAAVADIGFATTPAPQVDAVSVDVPSVASSSKSAQPVMTLAAELEYVPDIPAALPAIPAKHDTKTLEVVTQSEESILELAEMMLSMGLATGAAQKLVDHIRANPKKALAHWLKLLEIYRENGQRSNFEQAAKQLQKEFNIRASDWMRGTADRPRLEKFDRIFSKIEELWTRPDECIAFLSGMLLDNRDGQRVGFPQEVAEEILLLIEIQRENSGQMES